MDKIRVFLVDDEPHVRQGLRMRLEMEPDFQVVGEAGDGGSALVSVARTHPDVVLMDIEMPGKDGIDVANELRIAAPDCVVVIVSMRDDATTKSRAFAAGAAAFVGKHEIDGALTRAIRSSMSEARREERLCGWIGGEDITKIERTTSEREEMR